MEPSHISEIMSTEPRLLLAGLVPFKRYVRVRFTGSSRIVEFDGRREVFRSGLLPRPPYNIDVRYSRHGLYKRGYPKRRLRVIVEGFLAGLPRDRRALRLVDRLLSLRKRGLSGFLRRLRSEISRSLSRLSPRLIAVIAAKHGIRARRVEIRKAGIYARIRGLFGRLLGRRAFFVRGFSIEFVFRSFRFGRIK